MALIGTYPHTVAHEHAPIDCYLRRSGRESAWKRKFPEYTSQGNYLSEPAVRKLRNNLTSVRLSTVRTKEMRPLIAPTISYSVEFPIGGDIVFAIRL